MIKKQLIMEKALELFAENGIEATSIQQITERCGISKGAFYLSFKSKDQLVFGLIDHFTSEIVADIEQAVNENKANEDMLYHFYYTTFQAYQKHCHFAKIYVKEQLTSCNMEILERINKYDVYFNSIILSLVERQFSQVDFVMRADLVFVIKGFLKHYAELFFLSNFPIELDILCQSLVEKTAIIAEYATIPFITSELLSFTNTECLSPTKDQLMNLLVQKINESTDLIIKQSLELLKHDLMEPQLPPAVIQGLLKNLRDNSHSKWVAYLYELFLKNY